MAAIRRRKSKPFPREVVELHSRLKEVSELIEDDWRPAFRRNYSTAFQTRLSLLMERDRLVARIDAILNQPPPPPPVRDRVIAVLQLLGFGVLVLVGSVAASMLGAAALQWLFATPLAMGVLGLMVMWAALK